MTRGGERNVLGCEGEGGFPSQSTLVVNTTCREKANEREGKKKKKKRSYLTAKSSMYPLNGYQAWAVPVAMTSSTTRVGWLL
jgi:hypothetical protein